MAKQTSSKRAALLRKQEILEQSKATLKKEFIGIDPVIDQVVDAISSWFLFPNLQDKPVIINLWGLTGVGKSSLVNRLSELIGFGEKYYHFDLGEDSTRNWGIKSQLEKINENINGYPIIFSLDEFQHARTIDEMGKEIKQSSSRIIWQLLDSGKFQVSRYSFQVESLFELMVKLQYLVKLGVKVSKGKVVSDQALYQEHMAETKEKSTKNKSLSFVPKSYYDEIYSIAPEEFESPFAVKEKLDRLNENETFDFLEEVFSIGNSPKAVDCSKSLIFVMGNLDKAYTMSHNFSPDMEADEFHEQSLKINVPIIKKVLKQRFRNEQIARLGNTHIIYPAFNRQAFRGIIELELNKLAQKVMEQEKIKLEFDESVKALIYREGVYPTQGTRPIFTTVHQIVNTKLGRMMSELLNRKITADCLKISSQNQQLRVSYRQGEQEVHSVRFPLLLSLEKLRQNKRDDQQAIIAVHEAGHAVIAMLLMHTVPEVVYSNTAEVDSGGFVYTKFKWKYIAKQEIMNRLALYLGGLAAEKVVFGDERVTSGAEHDIEKATEFITAMLKSAGMSRIPAAYQVEDITTSDFVHDRQGKVNQEAEDWLAKAAQLAETTLREEKTLLLKLADHLSDHRQLNKAQLRDYLKAYAKHYECDQLIEKGDQLFYRQALKSQVAKLSKAEESEQVEDAYSFSLNKQQKD